MFFWRRRRDKGEDERESRSERRTSRAVEPDSDEELEAELAADREPADLDEAAGDEELEEGDEEDLDDVEALEAVDEDEAAAEGLDEEDEEDEDEEDEEPEPEDMTADLEAQAREFMADNDVWMYGDNARDVIAVLDRLEDVGPYEAEILVDLWQEITRSERELARKGIRRVVESDEEAERHVRLAREAIGNWVAVASDDPRHLADDELWPRHAAQVGEAAIDAVSAMILRDDLDEADFETLDGPWSEAIATWDAEAEGEEEGEGAEEESESDEDEADEDGEFGPNTRLVNELLNRLWLLPQEQVSRLVSNWQQAPKEELSHAHEALRDLVDEEPEYKHQVRRAQAQLESWLNSGRREESSAYRGRAGVADTHNNAGPALADAVAALVVGDLLDPEDTEALYAPWFKLVGAPPLPEPAPFEEEIEEKPPKGAKAKAKAKAAASPKAGPKPGAKPAPKVAPQPVAKPAPQPVAKAAAMRPGAQASKPAPQSKPSAQAGSIAPKPGQSAQRGQPPKSGQPPKPAQPPKPGQPAKAAQPAKPYKPVHQSGPVRPGKRAASKKARRGH